MDCHSLYPLRELSPQSLSCGIRRRYEVGEEVQIFVMKLIFAFPRKLWTSPRVPSDLDNRNIDFLQALDFLVHDLHSLNSAFDLYDILGSFMYDFWQAPPSPDYVPGPKEPEQAPPLPDFVSEPLYLKFMPPKDEVFLAEEQPLPAAVSPTTDSPGYITDSDPKEDPEEDPTDYPAIEETMMMMMGHSMMTRMMMMTLRRMGTRMRRRRSTHLWSTLSYHHQYTAESRDTIYFPSTTIEYTTIRDTTTSTDTFTYIITTFALPFTSHRVDVPEVTLPPRKRLCITLGPRYEVGESSSAPTARPTIGFRADYGFVATLDDEIRRDPDRDVGYEITDTWDEMLVGMPGVPPIDETELGQWMTNFVTTVRQDTDENYRRLDDAQDDRSEARLSRESWVQSMNASDTTRAEVMSLHTTMLAQQSEIVGLRAVDRPRQTQLVEALTLLKTLHTQMAALQRWRGPARGPAHPKAQEDSGHKMAPKRTTRSTPATTTTTTTTTPVTNAQLKALIDQGIADALVARNVDRSLNGEDIHDSGTGVRRQAPPTCECTYQDFMKCKPLYFKGTKGVFELTQWFERMEIVFCISNCTVENQIKFATCTLLESALTPEKEDDRQVLPKGQKLRSWRMFLEESDKIERYIGGLPDMIHESVMASKPKTMQDVIEFTTKLMDKKINTFAERHAVNERKFEDTSKNNQNQQKNKKQNTGRAYTAGSGEKKSYGGQKPTCFECGAQVHFKREFPKLKNNNCGNQGGNGNAPAKVYAVGHARIKPDSNVVTGMLLLNNRYASILFDTGADRSFVSTAFSSQIDITPTTLDHYYDVELADGRIIGLNTII
uniref:Reverse transcriptase domain-containing protein n=1 Tax=Tanacetum cinerariifolium TaxID=118510 RepID=A0A699GQ71_TANCI|nr:hypothetical protein [Tanacetum cinerariifolium]